MIARYFDVNTQTLREVRLNYVTPELCFPIEPRKWPVCPFDVADVTQPSFRVKVFRVGPSPLAAQGIFDYYYHRTRT